MNYSDGKPMQAGDPVIADVDGVAIPGAISEIRVDGKITFAHVHVERPSIALVHFKTVEADKLLRLEVLGAMTGKARTAATRNVRVVEGEYAGIPAGVYTQEGLAAALASKGHA